MKKENRVKQSLLIGALTSSFGMFVSKALGLLYYTPLTALAGNENMYFYSITYTYYDLLLKISGAGIPFAIAALVAKYCAKEDYSTALLVRKLGTSIIMFLSFGCASIFLLFANSFATQSLGAMASAQDIANLKILFYILSIAVIFVPYLSSIRGYYQGLKRLDLYASSQVLEQFVRVFSILFLGFICVKILKFDGIYAIFMAMSAAAIAAIISIVFFKMMTREDDKRMAELSKDQSPSSTAIELFKEIASLGIPYLVISFLGSASTLVNTNFFLNYATSIGIPYKEASLSMGILQVNCSKLASIPSVLTLGFSSGLVPYLTESYEKKDYKKLSKQIAQVIDTVLFILIPILAIFTFYAKDIYYIMYGGSNLVLASGLFRQYNLLTLTDTIAPILSSMMITLRKKKSAILILLASFISKFASFFLCVKLFGAIGMIYSSVICSLVAIVSYLVIFRRDYKINFNLTLRRLLMTVVASLLMVLPCVLLRTFIPFDYTSRVLCILIMGGLGLIMVAIYYFVTVFFGLPQTILGISSPSIRSLLGRFRR